MNIAVVATYPAATYKLRGESHKPSVAIAVGSTGLASYLAREVVLIAQSACRTTIDYSLEQHKHLVGTLLAYHLIHTGLEIGDDIALIVLNTAHEHRSSTYAMIGKCGIGAHHLCHSHLTRA